MNNYAVIIAGGYGTRFWPISRKKTPKQFQKLGDNEALINMTVTRLNALIPMENIFIITSEEQKDIISSTLLSSFHKENLIFEPYAMNTSAAIGYATMCIRKRFAKGTIGFFPADHFISDNKDFINTISQGYDLASKHNKIVTIGIEPSFPSTGYGYIKMNFKSDSIDGIAYNVEQFVEKPNKQTAQTYLDSGEYLWNGGMFIWNLETIVDSFTKHLPTMYKQLLTLEKAIDSKNASNKIRAIYENFEKISIDYGIMEKSEDVIVLPSHFPWSDVGSWDSMNVISAPDEQNNIISGQSVNIETNNSTILGKNRLIATLGISDLIIVDTDDALLICHKSRAQDVKKIVEALEKNDHKEFL